MVKIRTELGKLVCATLTLCIAFVVYAGVARAEFPNKEWKILLLTHVGVHDYSYSEIKEKLDNHSHPDINKEIPDHSHKPSTSYRFKKGTQFSLFYREGDLKTKKGICPEGSNLEWLKLFKTAILDSPKDKDRRIKLKIQGFASVAPVPVNGIINDKQSDSLNCEIANQRAEALIYFLTTEPYDSTKCKTALANDGRWGREVGKPYTRGRPDTLAWKETDFAVTYDDPPHVQWEGPNLTVTYKPWKNYKEIKPNKPMENPREGKERQLDSEFLNRSVRIIIEKGSDRTETMPAPPAEGNTG